MAGLFSRLKIWNAGESLTAADLNNEFNHFLSNVDATHSEGYSQNLSQMQSVENPGDLGSENLTQPLSVTDELQRLRYVINRIVGKSYWYQAPAQSLEGLNSTVSGIFGVSPSRIVSGAKTALSGFPTFLQANGASGVRLNASAGTPFNCFIDANNFSYTANISSGVLSGQVANNTATLASSLGGGQASKNATEFVISSAGAGITGNIGRQSIFSINNGSNTEYFLGTIASSTIITGIKRGYFYDTNNAAVPPITLTTGHTITMLRTTYVFLKNDGTLQVTYVAPSYMGTAPVSPSINDYWFDMTASTWKIFNGNWVVSNSIYIGMCAQGPTNTVCARSENFFANYSSINGVVIREISNSFVSTQFDVPANISVYGSLIKNDFKDFLWDMTSNMFPGETEASSTTYYFYLNNFGTSYISAVAPILESGLYGSYHPYEALRCVGSAFNNSSSDLVGPIVPYFDLLPQDTALVPTGTVMSFAGTSAPTGYIFCDGAAISRTTFRNLFAAIAITHGQGDGSTTFNIPDYRGRFLRGVDGAAARDPDSASRTAMNTGGNTANNVGSVQGHAFASHNHSATITGKWGAGGSVTANGSDGGGIGWSSGSAVSIGSSGGNETRPINAYVNYIIKV